MKKFKAADDIYFCITLNNLSQVMKTQKRFKEAEEYCKRSLELTEKKYGAAHRETGMMLSDFALTLADQNRHEEALVYLRRSAAIHEKCQGTFHLATAVAYWNLGTTLIRAKADGEEAILTMKKSHDIFKN
jgi:tetratricopeptide (TPR) repeat protein